MSETNPNARLSVLILHAPSDAAFAGELTEGLEFDGRFAVKRVDNTVAQDESGHSERGGHIADSDIIICVVSPAALISQTFDWEVAYAAELSKLMRHVVIEPVKDSEVPVPLRQLTAVEFGGDRSFMEGLKTLIGQMDVDSEWLRDHTALSVRARYWQENGRPDEYLLNQDETQEAKLWTASRPTDAPSPSELQIAYITASETSAHSPDQINQDETPPSATPPVSDDQLAGITKANKFYAVMSLLLAAGSSRGWLDGLGCSKACCLGRCRNQQAGTDCRSC